MAEKLTPGQARFLRYLARPEVCGWAEISGFRDLEMADRLAAKGFARISEMRPGFYAVHISDAGRAAIRKASDHD